MTWYVEIRKRLSDGGSKLERSLGPYVSERGAERAERGVNINLDHDEWFTVVTPTPDEAMKAKNTAAVLAGVRDILAADGVVCEVVGTRLLGERVGPDAPILADLGFSGSSLYWLPNKPYDQIMVSGASHPRTHKTELRAQPYTPNAKTGEWPIEKIVARIKLVMQTRATLGAEETDRTNALNAQAFAFSEATAAARAASSDSRRVRLTLGPRPTLTIEWPDTTPESVLAVLKSLEERS